MSCSCRCVSASCVWATFLYMSNTSAKMYHVSVLSSLSPKSRRRIESIQVSIDAGCNLLHVPVHICSKKLSPYNVQCFIFKHPAGAIKVTVMSLQRLEIAYFWIIEKCGVLTVGLSLAVSRCLCLTSHIVLYHHVCFWSISEPYFKHVGICMRHGCCCTICNPQNSCAYGKIIEIFVNSLSCWAQGTSEADIRAVRVVKQRLTATSSLEDKIPTLY